MLIITHKSKTFLSQLPAGLHVIEYPFCCLVYAKRLSRLVNVSYHLFSHLFRIILKIPFATIGFCYIFEHVFCEFLAAKSWKCVASAKEREEVREEVKEQDLYASEETRKAMGEEIGADYMLKGSINSIVDAISGEQARFYQIDLTLIELGSNRKVWVGQKKIKKTIEKGGLRL